MARQQRPAAARAARGVIQKLESLERAGVTHVPKRGRTAAAGRSNEPASRAKAAELPASEAAAPRRSAPDEVRPAAIPAARKDSLEIIQQEVVACQRCPHLASSRTQTVFGVGNPRARLCLLGEAPGADEDRLGEPFVGRAGQLLTKIIEACTLKREEVYILNVLKCRPPDNRTPLPDEIANCRGFLDRQLALINPEFICCLGTTAAQALLETTTPISRLRGRFHEKDGRTVICTYHPSYLLRNPAAKRDVWEDMKMLMREMGVELS